MWLLLRWLQVRARHVIAITLDQRVLQAGWLHQILVLGCSRGEGLTDGVKISEGLAHVSVDLEGVHVSCKWVCKETAGGSGEAGLRLGKLGRG